MAGSSCCLPQTLAAKLKLVPSHYDLSTNALTAEGGGAGTLPPPAPRRAPRREKRCFSSDAQTPRPASRPGARVRQRPCQPLDSGDAPPVERAPLPAVHPGPPRLEPLRQTGGLTAARRWEPGRFSAILTCALRQMLLKGSETETVNWKKRRVLDRLFLIFSPMFVSTVEG